MWLGTLAEGGLAPAIMAIVERGVNRRPAQARALAIEVELRMEEGYPPVRIVFGSDAVLVEDGAGEAPALRIGGALPDLVALLVAPVLGGVPSPMNARAAPRSTCSPRAGSDPGRPRPDARLSRRDHATVRPDRAQWQVLQVAPPQRAAPRPVGGVRS